MLGSGPAPLTTGDPLDEYEAESDADGDGEDQDGGQDGEHHYGASRSSSPVLLTPPPAGRAGGPATLTAQPTGATAFRASAHSQPSASTPKAITPTRAPVHALTASAMATPAKTVGIGMQPSGSGSKDHRHSGNTGFRDTPPALSNNTELKGKQPTTPSAPTKQRVAVVQHQPRMQGGAPAAPTPTNRSNPEPAPPGPMARRRRLQYRRASDVTPPNSPEA